MTPRWLAAGPLALTAALAFACAGDDEATCERAHALAPGPSGRLLVTTTDFSTGWLSIVDVQTRSVELDVALATTDAIPYFHQGRVYLVHRFGYDYIDVLDPEAGWASLGEYALETTNGAPANPQGLAFAADGLAYVSLYGAPELALLDLEGPPGSADQGAIDLSVFADDDGVPEAGIVIAHAGRIHVALQRLDQAHGFARVDDDLWVVVDAATRTLVDLDPDTPTTDGLALPGQWSRQWRVDPVDPSGATVALLSTGILRVDLEQPSWSWAVDESAFAAVGIADRLLPQSFDVDDSGVYWVAAYSADYSSVRIFRAVEGEVPVEVHDGLHSVEHTLEVVGAELWYGDTSPGRAGIRGFTMEVDDSLTPLSSLPLCTGLDPYSVRAIPAAEG